MTTVPPSATPATSAFTPAAPLECKPRRLVLCFDDEAGYPFHSNVIKLVSLLGNDGDSQMVYYQPGVGPYIGLFRPIRLWRFLLRVGELLDNAFALYLDEHVMSGYKWLVKFYNPGDRVYVFGFSRGAYTARVLAAMLHKVGLVSRDKLNNENERIQHKVSLTYGLYVSTSPNNPNEAIAFKKQYCYPIHIDFLGVWDTVPSVGLLKSRTLPFVDANASIRVFRQALSLDEHRSRFRPNLFRHDILNKSFELPETGEIFQTDVREVWFAGTHSDVGGGSVPSGSKGSESYLQHDLANISLRWMIEQLVHSCPIMLRYENFAWRKVPTTIGQDQPLSLPQGVPSTNEDVNALDARDALQSITDKLLENPLWWILEILPTSYTFQNTQGKWVTTFEQHFGRARQLPPDPLFHASVKTRMDDSSLEYKPRAQYEYGTEKYVS